MGFLDDVVVKNLFASAGDTRDMGLFPGSWRPSGVGNDNSFQYSCLENPMDRGVWWSTVHGITKIRKDQAHTEYTHTHTHTQKHKFSYTLQVNLNMKCIMNNLSF